MTISDKIIGRLSLGYCKMYLVDDIGMTNLFALELQYTNTGE